MLPCKSTKVLRILSDLTGGQLPWFLHEEFENLQAASTPGEVSAAARAADVIMLVGGAAAPRTQGALSVAMLDETRALREEATVSSLVPFRRVSVLTISQTIRERMDTAEVQRTKTLQVMKELLVAIKAQAPAKAPAKVGRGTKRARAREDEGEGRGEIRAGDAVPCDFLEDVAEAALAVADGEEEGEEGPA